MLLDQYGRPIASTVVPSAGQVTNETNGKEFTRVRKETVRRARYEALNKTDTITVLVDNPKISGSIAHRNWGLYHNKTVAEFVKTYPGADGGTKRAVDSLLWDLERGFVSVPSYQRLP